MKDKCPFRVTDSPEGTIKVCTVDLCGHALMMNEEVCPCHSTPEKEGCDKHNHPDCMECFYTTRAEMPEKDWRGDLNNIFTANTTIEQAQKIQEFTESLLQSQKSRIKEILMNVDKKWSICEDPKCPNREDCDTANHYISEFKKDLSDAATLVDNVK